MVTGELVTNFLGQVHETGDPLVNGEYIGLLPPHNCKATYKRYADTDNVVTAIGTVVDTIMVMESQVGGGSDVLDLGLPSNAILERKWLRLSGIRMALEVTLGGFGHGAIRRARVERIHGIERPLAVSDRNHQNFSSAKNFGDAGYVQGVVADLGLEHAEGMPLDRRSGMIELEVADHKLAPALVRLNNTALVAPGQRSAGDLQIGDYVRARVSRQPHTTRSFDVAESGQAYSQIYVYTAGNGQQ